MTFKSTAALCFCLLVAFRPCQNLLLGNSTLAQQGRPTDPRSLLNGGHLKLATLPSPPTVIIERHADGQVSYLGYCFEIINALQEHFNFTYSVQYPEDETFGVKKADGSWSGIIGMLVDGVSIIIRRLLRCHFQRFHCKEVDMGASDLSPTLARAQVVDFTVAVLEDSTAILIPAPAEDSKLFACFRPFQLPVWVVLLAAMTAVSLMLWLLFRLSMRTLPNESDRQSVSLFGQFHFVLAVLTSQCKKQFEFLPVQVNFNRSNGNAHSWTANAIYRPRSSAPGCRLVPVRRGLRLRVRGHLGVVPECSEAASVHRIAGRSAIRSRRVGRPARQHHAEPLHRGQGRPLSVVTRATNEAAEYVNRHRRRGGRSRRQRQLRLHQYQLLYPVRHRKGSTPIGPLSPGPGEKRLQQGPVGLPRGQRKRPAFAVQPQDPADDGNGTDRLLAPQVLAQEEQVHRRQANEPQDSQPHADRSAERVPRPGRRNCSGHRDLSGGIFRVPLNENGRHLDETPRLN